ncbi:MAG: hypothetical protein F2782_05805 [Actinobacteria bacterium]|uniref:Unannotated protein n=1 Tax=freshwater metagenome TaxID=449393 RepID=A0A6J7NGC6_9ZZZZ|nr:hypothetical protein [Actinomycetota bacterium]MSX33000.1 hypothetical protein [Actinomycetota bacterium]
MSSSSDHAELSALRSVLDDLLSRVVIIGDRYRGSDDSAVAVDIDSAERTLTATRRAMDRALDGLEKML